MLVLTAVIIAFARESGCCDGDVGNPFMIMTTSVVQITSNMHITGIVRVEG